MNDNTRMTPKTLDALLMPPAADAPAHEEANAEVAALRAVLSDLRSTSMAAADVRLVAPRPAALMPATRQVVPRWAMACATAAVAVAIAIPMALHRAPVGVADVTVTQPHIVAAADNAAQDDALLADIQSDLSSDVPASLQPLDTTSTNSSTSTK